MKPFDLNKANAGTPLITRHKSIVTDFKYLPDNNADFPIIAVVNSKIIFYTENGIYSSDMPNHKFDLFLDEPDEQELKTKNLNFSEALEWLKKSNKITRQCWNNKNIFIYLTNIFHDGDGTKEFRVITIQGHNMPWMPNHQELLANDWSVVDEI